MLINLLTKEDYSHRVAFWTVMREHCTSHHTHAGLVPVRRESDSLFTPRVKLIILLMEVRLHTLLLEIVQLLLVFLGQEEL